MVGQSSVFGATFSYHPQIAITHTCRLGHEAAWNRVAAPRDPENLTALLLSWTRATIEHTILLHTKAVGGASLAMMAASDPTSLAYKNLARVQAEHFLLPLKCINDEIDRTRYAPADILINAIAILVTHGTPQKSEEYYPVSPLAALQSLSPICALDLVPAHVAALYKAIEIRGGLRVIQLSGLAETLEA
jgi:hypothetical protein